MIKNKLKNARIEKGLSQEEMANLLFMDQSQYSRREKGIKRISSKEWEKIASILDKEVEDIYEDDTQITINNDNGSSGGFYSNNHYYMADTKSIEKIHTQDEIKTMLLKKISELEKKIKFLEENS